MNVLLLSLKQDTVIHWNNTLTMLNSSKINRLVITEFLYRNDGTLGTGKCKIAMSFSSEEWMSIDSLCVLLEPFQIATDLLHGEKYVSGSLVFPTLIDLKRSITNIMQSNNYVLKCKPMLMSFLESMSYLWNRMLIIISPYFLICVSSALISYLTLKHETLFYAILINK